MSKNKDRKIKKIGISGYYFSRLALLRFSVTRKSFVMITDKRTTYLIALMVLVNDPVLERLPPVFDGELLGVLLALAVAEPSLRLGVRDEMWLSQIYFEVLANLRTDLSFRTPSSAVLLLSNPAM